MLAQGAKSILIYSGIGSSPFGCSDLQTAISEVIDLEKYKIDFFNQDEGYKIAGNIALIILPAGDPNQMADSLSKVADKINIAVEEKKAAFWGFGCGAVVCCSNFSAPSVLGTKNDYTQISGLNFNVFATETCLSDAFSPEDGWDIWAQNVRFLPENAAPTSCFVYQQLGSIYHIDPKFYNKCRLLVKDISQPEASQQLAMTVLYQPTADAAPRLFTGINAERSAEYILSKEFKQRYNGNAKVLACLDAAAEKIRTTEHIRQQIFPAMLSALNISLK